MRCTDARQMIHSSLDNRLTEADAAALGEHLCECRGCNAYGETFGTLRKRVASLGAVKDTAGVAAILDRAMNAPVDSRRFTKRIFLLPPAKFKFPYTFLALLAVGIAVYVAMAAIAPANSMAATLLQEHTLRAEGRVALDVVAATAEDLERWFENEWGGRSTCRSSHTPG